MSLRTYTRGDDRPMSTSHKGANGNPRPDPQFVVLRADQCSGYVGLCVQNASTYEEACRVTHGAADCIAARERARIVAWLRREQATIRSALDAELFGIIADAIEAGEHELDPGHPKGTP